MSESDENEEEEWMEKPAEAPMKVKPKLEPKARELVELKRIEEARVKEEIKEEGKAGMAAVSLSDEEDDEGMAG